jgi:hypothetical protein
MKKLFLFLMFLFVTHGVPLNEVFQLSKQKIFEFIKKANEEIVNIPEIQASRQKRKNQLAQLKLEHIALEQSTLEYWEIFMNECRKEFRKFM